MFAEHLVTHPRRTKQKHPTLPVRIHPEIYTKQKSGSHTYGDINHQPTTVGTKTKAP